MRHLNFAASLLLGAMKRIADLLLVFCAISLLAPQPATAVTIAWSPVGNPSNAPDPATGSLYGAVPYAYNIGTYVVTASQYVEFLNAKDATGANTLGLYDSNMSHATWGGISFSADNTNGSKYSVIPGRGNHPANYTSWYNTVRFANWLNNGQGSGDTETGAYEINANSVARQAGATVFLPSKDEWYKAAYYNPGTNSYFRYPTSSNSTPTPDSPTATPNTANYARVVNNLTDVGAYTGTTSPYGAFDMGGNVTQWLETDLGIGQRGLRGISFFGVDPTRMLSSRDNLGNDGNAASVEYGFRVASIPLPVTTGDLNGDGLVDRADLSILVARFGTPSGATSASGDLDGDGAVSLADLTKLQVHFTTATAPSAPIPEPGTIALVLAAIAGCVIARSVRPGRRRSGSSIRQRSWSSCNKASSMESEGRRTCIPPPVLRRRSRTSGQLAAV